MTAKDLLFDSTWLITLPPWENADIEFPCSVLWKTNIIMGKLLEHLKGQKIEEVGSCRQIIFAGHSLGGALSIALHLQLDRFQREKSGPQQDLFGHRIPESAAFAIGAPLVCCRSTKCSIVDSSANSTLSYKNIHNLVYQLDLVSFSLRFLYYHSLVEK